MPSYNLPPLHWVTLFTIAFISLPISQLPNNLMKVTLQDAWISLLLSYLIVFILLSFACLLIRANIAKAENAKCISWIPKLLLLPYLLFLLISTALTIRAYTEVVHNYFLQQTPPLVISLLMVISASYGAWYGLISIGRSSLLGFLLAVLALFTMPLLVSQDVDLGFFLPVLSHPLDMIGASVWQTIGPLLECFYVFSLATHLPTTVQKAVGKLFVFAFFLSVLLFSIMFFLDFLVFGPYLSAKFLFPSVELVKYLRLGEFMERLDIILVSVWTVIMTIKVMLLLYVIGLESTAAFSIASPSLLLIPTSIFLLFFSQIMAPDILSLLAFYQHGWTPVVLVAFCFYLTYQLIILLRKR